MHHFSSFNNQWYRKSIEYMQEVDGVQQSKWCAGCHDPALLFSGMFDKPIKESIDTPEANAGLSCMMCHSIVQVKSTMGQGDFVLEYPKLHELAASENPVIRALHDFMVRLNPEPHRRVFLKPFMREQVPEFCSGCHKVHLDQPFNNYRWLRGFNEYDNWQASGVSGQGARAFYYPATSMMCADCHMPLVPSKDEGNLDGYVHSHRFPGANTAVPVANEDPRNSKPAAISSRTSNSASIFSRFLPNFAKTTRQETSPTIQSRNSPPPSPSAKNRILRSARARRRSPSHHALHSAASMPPSAAVTMCSSTSSCAPARSATSSPAAPSTPSTSGSNCRPPMKKARPFSGAAKSKTTAKAPSNPARTSTNLSKSTRHGNPINKRNAWATRAVVYVHLIPPGAADTAHFRLHIPETAGEHITLHSKLNYRKFQWWNTHFSLRAGTIRIQQACPRVTPKTTTTAVDVQRRPLRRFRQI